MFGKLAHFDKERKDRKDGKRIYRTITRFEVAHIRSNYIKSQKTGIWILQIINQSINHAFDHYLLDVFLLSPELNFTNNIITNNEQTKTPAAIALTNACLLVHFHFFWISSGWSLVIGKPIWESIELINWLIWNSEKI